MKLNIAMGQMHLKVNNKTENLKKMLKMIDEAAGKEADIIAFPEFSYTGYVDNVDDLKEVAETSNGYLVQELSKKAKEKGIHIVAGYMEIEDDKIYNSCIFIDDTGETLDNARKLYLWGEEKENLTEADKLKVIETKFGKVGILICYDLEYPEPTRILALKGAEIVIGPSFWSRDASRRWEIDLSANALFNLLYVVGINAVGRTLCGKSQIVAPNGEVIAIASEDSEEVLVQEINLEKVTEIRSKIPYFNDFKEDTFSMDAINKF